MATSLVWSKALLSISMVMLAIVAAFDIQTNPFKIKWMLTPGLIRANYPVQALYLGVRPFCTIIYGEHRLCRQYPGVVGADQYEPGLPATPDEFRHAQAL
jgi:hypothetical protein